MLWQMQSLSLDFYYKLPIPTKNATDVASHAPFSIRPRSSKTLPSTAGDEIPAALISKQQMPKSPLSMQSLVSSAAPPNGMVQNLGFRPPPELGLLSHLFVISMAFGAFFSVAVISIPTTIVVSEEVPGTLSSLKLSSMELNDLTQQLGNLRNNISGVRIGKKGRSTISSRSFHKKNPAS